jgi:molecular chaperone DnaK (HSP70)
MAPPPSECKPGHEWCVLACRNGRDSYLRVAPHFGHDAEAIPNEPTALAHTLAIETLGAEAFALVQRCAALPVEVADTFSTAADNQPQVEIVLVAGESTRAAENQLLGRVILDGIPPAPRGVPQIEVRVRVERNGVISARAKDLKTGRVQAVSLR